MAQTFWSSEQNIPREILSKEKLSLQTSKDISNTEF